MNTKAKREQPSSAEEKDQERERVKQDALVDLEGEQSFPASDPPSWTFGRES